MGNAAFPGGSRERVNLAGRRVRDGSATDDDIAVINEWRAAHRHVINTFQSMLRQRATTKGAVAVGQRLKRRSTIFDKLQRHPKMALGRMDDVAGLRVIFNDEKQLQAFRADMHRARIKHERHSRDGQYDYISHPKSNGYRGVHDIYRYNVNSKHAERAPGLFIEIQYRTLVQHSWATANEVIGYVTDSEPKYERGDDRYVRFMALASEILARAHEQRRGPLPDIPDDQLLIEMRDLERDLKLLDRLSFLRVAKINDANKRHYILVFSREGKLEVRHYDKNRRALAALFKLENEQPDSNVVLVGAGSPDEVELSFRNYFSDTVEFADLLRGGIEKLGWNMGRSFLF